MAKILPGFTPALMLTIAGAVTAGAGFMVFATSSDRVLANSFGSALEAAAPKDVRVAKPVPVAGSEGFWLSAMQQVGPAPLTKTVSIGDRITMTLSGVERHLDVISVAEFDPKVTTIDTSAQTHFVLVTARDTGDANARPIRFAVELQTDGAPILTTAARTL
jgi:hypothetical protein